MRKAAAATHASAVAAAATTHPAGTLEDIVHVSKNNGTIIIFIII
jgi:hypothetical protein